jgi:hypothetical protein
MPMPLLSFMPMKLMEMLCHDANAFPNANGLPK